jgi:hypothetical protein
MSPDWAARATAVPYASFGDPQTLNLYTYVENSPLNRTDADGHSDFRDGGQGPTGTQCSPGEGGAGSCAASANQTTQNQQAQNKQNPPQVDSNGNPTFNPPSAKPPAQAYEKTPTADYKADVPRATGALQNTITCTQECSGQRLTVTSTNEAIPQHPADTPHGRGEAADLRVAPGTENKVLGCAAQCGAQFGLNESAHPSAHATGPHVHIQLVPGRNGGRGDLPPDE